MRPSCSIHQGPAAPGGEPQGVALERMTTGEVLALARISRATLWRRIACGRLPRPVDQAREALFSKVEVIQALASAKQDPASVAIEQRLEALRRRRQKEA
jgi:predicted DNA-binding transcriptional regulator AlpA